MNENTKLYFKGLIAKVITIFGGLLLLIGVIGMMASKGAGIILFIVGIVTVISGKAMRFDYQRKSGHILHKGD
jgi:membrane-bound ClpP family serine protease